MQKYYSMTISNSNCAIGLFDVSIAVFLYLIINFLNQTLLGLCYSDWNIFITGNPIYYFSFIFHSPFHLFSSNPRRGPLGSLNPPQIHYLNLLQKSLALPPLRKIVQAMRRPTKNMIIYISYKRINI